MRDLMDAEIRKLRQRKQLLMFVAAAAAVAAFLFLEGAVGKNGGETFRAEDYNRFVLKIQKEDTKEAYEKIRKKYENGNVSDDALYQEILGELKQVNGYPEYIREVEAKEDDIDNMLFQTTPFTKANTKKTVKEFKKFKDVTPVFCGTYGIRFLTRFDGMDAVLVIFMVLLSASLITAEREEGKLEFLRSFPKGRRPVGIAKYIVGSLLMTAGFCCMLLYKVLVIWLVYGLDHMSEVIQSVHGYQSCAFKVSIGEYLLLVNGGKLFAFLSVYSVVFFIAAYMKKSFHVYMLCFLLFGVSWLLTVLVDARSFISGWKWMNVISLLNADGVLSTYRNLNLSGTPVEYHVLAVCVEGVLLFAAALFGILCFAKGREHIKKEFVSRGFWNPEHVKEHGMIYQKTFLFLQEAGKIWRCEKGFWICLLFVLLAAVNYDPLYEHLTDENEISYRSYCRKVEGGYTDAKVRYLEKERERFRSYERAVQSEDIPDVRLQYMNEELKKRGGLEEMLAYGQYLKEKKEQKLHPSFVYSLGYETLFGKEDGRIPLFRIRVLSVLMLVGMVVPLWEIEYKSRMHLLIPTTKVGWQETRSLKRFHVFLLAFLSWAVSYLPWIYNVRHCYGFARWNAWMFSMEKYEWVPSFITIGDGIFLFFFLHFLYLFGIGLAAEYAVKKLKTSILASFVLAVTGCLPFLIL